MQAPTSLLRRLGGIIAGAALVAAASTVATGTAAQDPPLLQKYTLAVDTLPSALCNDGTAPVFYFRPGVGEERRKWLIVFQDGGSCTSDAACATRARGNRYFLSGTDPDLVPAFTGDGILSPVPEVNPDFARVNQVMLHYCSSDAFAGDTVRTIEGATWQFRGKQIVDALIGQLAAAAPDGGPTLAEANDVLLAGSSAGALGVHNNLDRVAARLPGARVRGLVDSAWIPVGTVPFTFGTFAARPDQPGAMAYWSAHPDDTCVVDNPRAPGQCLNQAFAARYVATPMFIYADQRDMSILASLGIPHSPISVDEGDYVLGFAADIRRSLRDSPHAFFAANITVHNVLLWSRYARVTADDDHQTFARTLHRWYAGEPGDVRVAAAPPGTPPLSLAR